MHAVNEVDVREAGRSEEHLVAQRLAGKGVCRRIAEPEVCLHLDDSAGQTHAFQPPHQTLAQQSARYVVGRVQVEIAGQDAGFRHLTGRRGLRA